MRDLGKRKRTKIIEKKKRKNSRRNQNKTNKHEKGRRVWRCRALLKKIRINN